MSFSKTATPLRRLTRVAVAGALIAVPLVALAATASAETPAAPTDGIHVLVVDGPEQGIDINRPRHFERYERHDGPCPGPGLHLRRDAPPPRQFQQFLPPTGSS
ncbi:hypothetical protein OHA40_15980 [Nocardia sp. NBC_00508]|uniref:hypothetical protein n=1 Tax=Nocardia sp. NBC_00508 TaxID=2975992 RepID=UPI002E7FF17D|nr:hypothetical protein [Nocardia sp. NBC_00508]WUD69485.1 hypothetical protein OHA40_15980 [Nocardia sp. NBC_00508]